jgi:hypothetical protein
MPRGPQGRPVFVQAGSSDTGRRFAARLRVGRHLGGGCARRGRGLGAALFLRVILVSSRILRRASARAGASSTSSAIDRDLNRIFTPVKLKGLRRERISGAQMVSIHLKHLGYKRPGAKMKRYGGPYYVDRRKVTQLVYKLRAHVGRLAAGWMPAAAALGVAAPAWIARHGLSRGTYRADFAGSEMFIESVNHASEHAPTGELQRRVGYALQYQANAMHREMHHLLLKDATSVGMQVA